MNKLLDGRHVVEEISKEISFSMNKERRLTGAFIQVGHNPASDTYVRNKLILCEKWGINPAHHKFPEDVTEEELIDFIEELNSCNKIHGIMVQLPLPDHIDEQRVINAIAPEKDIDGFTDINKGRLMNGDPRAIIPCTPKGIMTMLEVYGLSDLKGKKVTIVGRSNIVGKPLAQLMINKGAMVVVCNSNTPKAEIVKQIKSSHIFVSAIGRANYFNQRFFVEHTRGIRLDEPLVGVVCPIAIDVGINRDKDGKLCGDISKDLHKYFEYVTPVPNGVGRTTVLEVVRNIGKCWEVQNGKHR